MMTDLNLKKKTEKTEDTVGVIILALMPFAWIFIALIERGL